MRRSAGWSRPATGVIDSETPLLRYFLVIGGALLALLFAADAVLPKPANEVIHSDAKHPTIRIHSETKRTDAVVIDTNQPTIVPVPAKPVTTEADVVPENAVPLNSPVRESIAHLIPPSPDQAGAATEPNKPKHKRQLKRKMAKVRFSHQPIRPAQPPHSGFFDINW